jgi:CDP-diacylglycerol--glycerol-3-phosphate 3-phosphatidyltransferase
MPALMPPKIPFARLAQLRLHSRIWRVLRILVYFPIFYFIWERMPKSAAACLLLVLGIELFVQKHYKSQEIEKPYYQLFLSFVEGIFVFAVMLTVFLRDYLFRGELERVLAVGCVCLLTRVVAHTLFSLGVLREGKDLRERGFWPKAAALSINVTTLLYVTSIEYYQQIMMVVSILFMAASSAAYFYWYYRDPDHRKPLSIASQLTMSRIVLTPVFLWVFFYDNNLTYQDNNMIFKTLALVMVVAFMLTDFLDGYLARKMGEVSTLGKYLDPFSDKISNMTIFLCFLASDYASVWMVALIYFREASVETLRTLAANEGITMPARWSGKIKTAIQGIGILIILVGALDPVQASVPHWAAIWEYLPQVVMGVITLVTLASGVDYFVASKNVLKKYV